MFGTVNLGLELRELDVALVSRLYCCLLCLAEWCFHRYLARGLRRSRDVWL